MDLIQNNSKFYTSSNRPQNATAFIRKRNEQYLPYVFTAHGIAMAASVLKSEKSVIANIAIVNAFIAPRQIALHHKELAEKPALLENNNNKQFKGICEALNYLIDKSRKKRISVKDRGLGLPDKSLTLHFHKCQWNNTKTRFMEKLCR